MSPYRDIYTICRCFVKENAMDKLSLMVVWMLGRDVVEFGEKLEDTLQLLIKYKEVISDKSKRSDFPAELNALFDDMTTNLEPIIDKVQYAKDDLNAYYQDFIKKYNP